MTASFVSGDRSALEQLYRRSGSLVHTLALRALGDPNRADDVTRRTFVAAWVERQDFQPDRISLLAWLMSLARDQITTTEPSPGAADPAPEPTHHPRNNHPC